MKNTLDFIQDVIAARKYEVVNAAGITIKLPATEFAVLATLHQMSKPAHGPAIAEAAEGRIPLATVYGSLRRLQARGCAGFETNDFAIAESSSKVRRTMWHATVSKLPVPQEKKTHHDFTIAQNSPSTAVG